MRAAKLFIGVFAIGAGTAFFIACGGGSTGPETSTGSDSGVDATPDTGTVTTDAAADTASPVKDSSVADTAVPFVCADAATLLPQIPACANEYCGSSITTCIDDCSCQAVGQQLLSGNTSACTGATDPAITAVCSCLTSNLAAIYACLTGGPKDSGTDAPTTTTDAATDAATDAPAMTDAANDTGSTDSGATDAGTSDAAPTDAAAG